MEHILISPGKLKLMLTKDDLEHYKLDHTVDESCAVEGTDASRMAFRLLLDDAGRITGFDAGRDKLFIQLYPSKDGGAEVYITKLGRNGRDSGFRDENGTSPNERVKINRIGVFDSMNNLLECCRHIRCAYDIRKQSDVISSAYSDGKRYFLVISESLSYREYLDSIGRFRIEAAFGEYGRNTSDPAVISYIKEHCFVFCEKKAVKILADMV